MSKILNKFRSIGNEKSRVCVTSPSLLRILDAFPCDFLFLDDTKRTIKSYQNFVQISITVDHVAVNVLVHKHVMPGMLVSVGGLGKAEDRFRAQCGSMPGKLAAALSVTPVSPTLGAKSIELKRDHHIHPRCRQTKKEESIGCRLHE